jgi:hypothetical protein
MTTGRTWFALALAVAACVFGGCSKGHCGKCAKDSDCGSGLACDLRVGACKALGEAQGGAVVCPADCTNGEACGHEGKCTLKGGACVIDGEADCRRSPACANEGRCALRFDACVPVSDTDCRSSSWCNGMGLCTLQRQAPTAGVPADYVESHNKCVAGSDVDCKASNACTKDRKCFKYGDWCAEVSEKPPTPSPAKKPGEPCNPDFEDCSGTH